MTPTVVLLHGLARKHGSMSRMAQALAAAGFTTRSIDYPSRQKGIADVADAIADQLAAELPGRPLAAVTHSLGGILFRHLGDPRLAWRRAVLLAPPNRGSHVAATFAHHPLYRWFYGPAGQELAGAGATWPPPPAPCGVIAGTRRRAIGNPTSWVSGRVFGPDQDHDGTVAVDETRLDGAAFITVDASHTTIMNEPRVQALTVDFLRDGHF